MNATYITMVTILSVLCGAGQEAPVDQRAQVVVIWRSDPVGPDEVVLLAGGGWGEGTTVEIARLDDRTGKPAPPTRRQVRPIQVRPRALKFVVPGDLTPGLFCCRITSQGQTSRPVVLNAPTPWWIQGDAGKEASPGGWVRVFGRCLCVGEQATVRLHGPGGERTLTPSRQDLWSVEARVPPRVPVGTYTVAVHNGRGGPAGWCQAGRMRVAVHRPVWKDTRFDVTAFGARANDGVDDTAAFQQALAAAEKNGGGTVVVPRGRFQMNDSLHVPRFVLLKGQGSALSQVFWRDRDEPFEALLYATNSFGIEDLTILSANHRYGILADSGDRPGAGHVTLRRLVMRLNRLLQTGGDESVRRFRQRGWEHAIAVGGDNVQVTDCEVFSSLSPFGFVDVRDSVIRNNRFTECGPSYVLSGSRIIFEDNRIDGETGARGGAMGGRECVYFARNRLGPFAIHDAEAFTTDGGGSAYKGKIAGTQGTTVTLAGDVRWNRWGHIKHLALFIITGTGAGQARRIVSHRGRQAHIDRPWDIVPDETSVAHITFYCMRYLLVDNEFHDAAIGIQSYTSATDWVMAGNRTIRAGGLHNLARADVPSWYVQYLGNEIVVGSGYRGPRNRRPPSDSHLQVQSAGPLARATVFRRNVLHNNARIHVMHDAQDVVIDHNTVRHADQGVCVGSRAKGVAVWRNRFDKVDEPLVGAIDKAFAHPAERALAWLGGADVHLPTDKPAVRQAWQRAVKKLEALAAKDPGGADMNDAVRRCVAEWLVAVARVVPTGHSAEALRRLCGVRWGAWWPNRQLREMLASGSGGKVKTYFRTEVAPWSVPMTVTFRFPELAACRIKSPVRLRATPGKGASTNLALVLKPGVWSTFSVPVQWTGQGQGWRLSGTDRLTIGDIWSGPIGHWAICGPFPNANKNVLDDAVHGPERSLLRLDLGATFNTLGGKQGWKPVQATEIDLVKHFGKPQSAVAYAVAALRAKRPTPVWLDLQGPGHGTLAVYLNGKPLRMSHKYGHQASRTLETGINVLFIKVVNREKRWTLRARGGPVRWAEPGDVEIVPTKDLFKLKELRPPAGAPIREGTDLPLGDGLDWRLAFHDEFDRVRIGTDWRSISHEWRLKDGAVDGAKGIFWYLILDRPVRAPVRMEFDLRFDADTPPYRTLAVCLTPRQRVAGRRLWHDVAGSGYMLCLGWHNRRSNQVWREAEEVLVRRGGPLTEPGKWHHVVAQFAPPQARLVLDGKVALEYKDKQWLKGLDTLSLFAGWGPMQIDNVRVYAVGSAR